MSIHTYLKDEQTTRPIQISLHDEINQTLTLKDGRKLGFAQYGDPSGKPVFYFHGGAGSRLEQPANICAVGVRLIAPDRPGHGLSDFQQGRELLDWPNDIAQLANHLGIDKFHVLGWSAGGPHALACAYRLPERVMAGAVAAGLAPMNRPGAMDDYPLSGRAFAYGAQHTPKVIGLFRRIARNTILGDAEEARQQLLAAFPKGERDFMETSGNLDMLYRDVCEGYRSGWRGVARDDLILFRDWGFKIADIRVRIDIWHGELDKNIPCSAGAYMHQNIPNSRATFLSGEGHLFLLRHWSDVLHTLVVE